MRLSSLLPVIPYLLLFSASSSAINALPEKTGFSGYLNVGLAYLAEKNTINFYEQSVNSLIVGMLYRF